MDLSTATKAVDFINNQTFEKEEIGLSFYGGEPLLQRTLIYDTIIYSRMKYPEKKFTYNLTTNGMLLDEEFCWFAKEFNVLIAVSIDGTEEAHDKHRVDLGNNGSYERVMEKAKMLLEVNPSTPVMMTVNPDTAPMLEASVRHLYEEGFRYILCTLNYKADWNDEDLKKLEHEYNKLADLYYEMTMKEEKFYFSPFDVKIASHIFHKDTDRENCILGKKHISVSTSGHIYPCIQFVDDDRYLIGHVETGFDEVKREELSRLSQQPKEICDGCAVKHRCRHYCACLNMASTGDINQVSPLQCEHERMLIEIADSVARKLYKKKNAMFIQKQYNEMYPVISAIEDKIRKGKNNK